MNARILIALCATVCALNGKALALDINTVAGGGTANIGDGYEAEYATTNRPQTVHVDAAGNIYIAEWNGQRVRKIDTSGIITTIAGTGVAGFSGDNGPATAAQLNTPSGVWGDNAGNVYIAEWSGQRVRKVNTSGIITTIAGTGSPGYTADNIAATGSALNNPADVAVDAAGNVYIADYNNQRIRKVDTSGIITTVAGNGISGYLGDNVAAISTRISDPLSVLIDAAGNLYIADAGNKRIRKVDTAGIITTIAGNGSTGYAGDGGLAINASLNVPSGLYLDAAGNLFFASQANHVVRKVDTAGFISTVVGTGVAGFSGDGGPAVNAQINVPPGIFGDGAGNLYVADFANDRIRKVDTSDIITTFVGNGGVGDGGPATSAFIDGPAEVYIDAAGDMYIADINNNRVRKIDTAGTVTTFAGNGVAGLAQDGTHRLNAKLRAPIGIHGDAAGNIYVSERDNHRIIKIDPAGLITAVAGTGSAGYSGDNGPATAATLNNPHRIYVDPAGTVYISEQGNNAVRKVNAATGIITTFAGPPTGVSLNGPQGVYADAASNVFIADTGNNRILRVTPSGTVTTPVGSGLNGPIDVHVDASGTLFISDINNHRIRRINTSGTTTGLPHTIAGTGVAGFSGDGGPAPGAQLNKPIGLFVNDQGEIFIGDFDNDRVRKLTTPLFEDLTATANLYNGGAAWMAAWGDYNGDGYQDLYVTNTDATTPDRLFRNDGNGAFSDVAPGLGLDDTGVGSGVAFADYDNDGDLDYYLSKNGGVNKLYRNNGATFTDVAGDLLVAHGGPGRDVAWADMDLDGDLDFYLANYGTANQLYRNDGSAFEDIGVNPGTGTTGNSTGVSWADYDNDGDPDIYLAQSGGNAIFRNDGISSGVHQFPFLQATLNVGNGSDGRGIPWGDYDNDGDLDLYLANSNAANLLYENPGNGTAFANVAGATFVADGSNTFGAEWVDYDNDGDLDLATSNWNSDNRLYENPGSAPFAFVDRAGEFAIDDAQQGRGLAFADYDNDGDLDFFNAVTLGTSRFFRNNLTGANWLHIDLEGTASNRSGLGTRISAQIGASTQIREVQGSTGQTSHASLTAEFGLGSATVVDQLTIEWPSGLIQTLNNVAVNQLLSLIEINTVDVSIPDLTSPYNQLVTVPVQVSETSGAGIVSAEVFICYDGDLLTPTGVDITGTLLTPDWAVETNIEDGGQIDTYKIAMATDDDVLVGAGTLVNITFQVANNRVPSSSALTLKHVLFNDGDPGNVTTDGSLTLTGTDGTITSLPATIIPRETVTITVVDADLDTDGAPDTDNVVVSIDNSDNGDTINLPLAEDGTTAGTFSATYDTEFGPAAIVDALLQADAGDALVAAYSDALDGAGVGPTNRTATTNVIGGADGLVEITIVSQPGDPLYIQVTDADLNTDTNAAETVSVTVDNPNTSAFNVVLTEVDDDDDVFFGSLATIPGASTGTELGTAEDDVVTVTYDDVVTLVGDQQDRTDINDVIFPWGDADDNDALQAFDAAKILLFFLNGTPIDEQAANVDDQTVSIGVTHYDASLVLQKRVGLISTFPVQDSSAENHPQGDPSSAPKRMPKTRSLSLVAGEGYLSVHAIERGDLLSGDLTLQGITGRVEMGAELTDYLSASKATNDGLRIVFAGAEAVSGPGELLRIYGIAPGTIELNAAVFNNGEIIGTASGLTSMATPQTFALHPNMPNPFNPETTIRFELPQAAETRLEIFDVLGQKVLTLVAGQLQLGIHSAVWDGRDEGGIQVGNGVYLYRLQAGEFTQMRRMLLLK